MKQRMDGGEFTSTGQASHAQMPPRYTVPPPPDASLDAYLASGPQNAVERRTKQKKLDEQKKLWAENMIIRNITQTASDEPQPYGYVRIGRKCYANKYGDSSGIKMWGYDIDTNLWVVKRNSGNVEHYDKKVDFHTWTKIDLTELTQAPFLNPYDF